MHVISFVISELHSCVCGVGAQELAAGLNPGVSVGDRVYQRGMQMKQKKERRVQEHLRKEKQQFGTSSQGRAKSAGRSRP